MAKARVKTTRREPAPTRIPPAEVLFASSRVDRLEPNATLPKKFERILDRLHLEAMVKGQVVAIKMHLGGNVGYTTIPPLFVRLLVAKVKALNPKRVFVTDAVGAVAGAAARGYTSETLGCPLWPVAGPTGKYAYAHPVKYRTLKKIEVAGAIQDADVLINFSHVKGHGDCAYGGACKNIAMGCVTDTTRGDIHELEGGLTWIEGKCTHCGKCVEACERGAASFDKEKRFTIFYHHCAFCRHCQLACPTGAIKITDAQYGRFQEGMALCTKTVLDTFQPGKVLFINVLTDITIYCDCWGMSTPSLVPDIGLLASDDIVAVEQASLDLIKVEDLIPGSLPEGRQLGAGRHLLEKIHFKDPFIQVAALEKAGLGTRRYTMKEIL
jgi:uncharacterized Fe-S center protein